jgi:anti-anti-sigma regulatory factor
MRAVAVKKVPEICSVKQKIAFLHEIESVMSGNRPRLVLDCSGIRDCDGSVIHLLLHCLEEAMKRNGDVRLASVPIPAQEVLINTGVARLFELYESAAEAVNSFHQVPKVAGAGSVTSSSSNRVGEAA